MGDDCQVAFERIKRCLMNRLLLIPPVPGRLLILYMTMLDESIGCVLGQHDESKKKMSHLLLEQEIHNMRDELLVAREDVLCLGMGNSPFEAIYVELHYLVGIQNGSSQVHLQKTRSHLENSSMAGFVVRVSILFISLRRQ